MGNILDGKALAEKFRGEIKAEIAALKAKGVPISLAAVQVGENAASRMYVKKQKEGCEEMGIAYTLHELPAETTQDELLAFVDKLNNDRAVTGIILQMPVPEQIDARVVQRTISPDKDVEGLHPANMGRLVFGEVDLAPCTALGAIELLKSSGEPLKGKDITVVGHSEIVGKPIALILLASQMESATPTVCHIATRDLASHTCNADVVIVAAGKPGLVTGDMVKEGVILVDVGINRVPVLDENGQPVLNQKGKPKKKTVGDAVYEEIEPKASYISPVPGGVGPLTVVMLMRNTVTCAKRQQK